MEQATFGGGCFWCTEAIFRRVRGVTQVVSGYAGGDLENPTYQRVCEGGTGHAEVIQVTFDPQRVSYQRLLEIFFFVHDPTTANRQGADVGTQYRSVILYHSDPQRATAESVRDRLNEDTSWGKKILTEILPLEHFYPAEDAHQDYFARHARQPYCQAVIRPKITRFVEQFESQPQSGPEPQHEPQPE